MALNSSGAISLAGATTGESIAIEIGQSSTATISLNDANVRSLAGISSGVISMPIDFWGKSSGGPYFIGLLGSASFYDAGYGVAADTSGNIYFAGQSAGSSFTNMETAKYNSSGTIQWQRIFSGPDSILGYAVALDSSNNVYVCGQSNPNTSGFNDAQINKYNSSGVLQWQNRLYGSFGVDNQATEIAVDSSGNAYICGYTQNPVTSNYNLLIAKYNTSGTLQWQRSLEGAVGNDIGNGIAVDSSANVYVCGRFSRSGYVDTHLVAKYNSSGTIQWQTKLELAGTTIANGIAVDSSGNSYVCGYDSSYSQTLVKYDTSGTLQWQRKLSGGVTYANGVAVDSSGNSYVCGFSTASGTGKFEISKYNTSGTIQWQRQLGSSVQAYGAAIAVNSSGSAFYVCGYSYVNTSDFLFAKLPGDGSLTGTYTVGGNSFTYSASSLTDSAASMTSGTSSLTDAAISNTSATSSYTDAASTLTSSVTTL
jgi:hypothetical protein